MSSKPLEGKIALTRRQTDRHRQSIAVSNILSLLQRNAEGKLIGPDGEPYELSPSRLKSLELLLNKALPSLQAVDVTTSDEKPPLSPAEVELEMGKLLRSMPKAKIERLMHGATALNIIEGEKVDSDVGDT